MKIIKKRERKEIKSIKQLYMLNEDEYAHTIKLGWAPKTEDDVEGDDESGYGNCPLRSCLNCMCIYMEQLNVN